MTPLKLIQKCAPYIVPEITKLVNNSTTQNIFPNDLKFVEVSSLIKNKDALSLLNHL